MVAWMSNDAELEASVAAFCEPEDHRSAACVRYMVNPAERVKELLFTDEIPDTAELTYSFSQGYEKLDYKASEQSGSLHFAGAYHPGDGMCDGEHICSFCGRVHTYG